jgi:hypothetical protein
MLEVPKLIGEVARRNGIRVEADDPAFALVTLNQLILEDTVRELRDHIRESIAEFDVSIQKVQTRAGRLVAQEFHERAMTLGRELQDDISQAGSKATELVCKVQQAHARPARTPWTVAGLFLAILVFLTGYWVGVHHGQN